VGLTRSSCRVAWPFAVGRVGLLDESGSLAVDASRGAHEDGDGEGGVDAAAHGVGH